MKDPKDDLQDKIDAAKKEDEKRNKKSKKKDEVSEEIANLKKDLEDMTEMARRSMADLQNLKRRQEEERFQIISRANINLLKEFLPAFDNLQRALEHIPAKAEEWAKGVSMSITQIEKVLQEAGLKPIETEGQQFNPDLHEALLQGPGKKDLILEELEKGYMIGGQVLRHSKVKVGNGEKA